MMLCPCSVIIYRIVRFGMIRAELQRQRRDLLIPMDSLKYLERDVSDPLDAMNKISFDDPNAVAVKSNGSAMSWMAKIDSLHLVMITGGLQYLRLILDCISWTYDVITADWDLVVVVIDGISITCGTLSTAMLVFVLIQRCYVTFGSSPSQHSSMIYSVILAFNAAIVVFSVLCGIFSLSKKWQLLAGSVIGFVVCLSIAGTMSIYFFVQPLKTLARFSSEEVLLHVAVRLSVVATASMLFTVITYTVAAITYNECGDECTATVCNTCTCVCCFFCLILLFFVFLV